MFANHFYRLLKTLLEVPKIYYTFDKFSGIEKSNISSLSLSTNLKLENICEFLISLGNFIVLNFPHTSFVCGIIIKLYLGVGSVKFTLLSK